MENKGKIATINDAGVSTHLPTIDDLPNADVVIFDGQCNFCRNQVNRLGWFTNGRVAFLSLHDPRVGEICPELTKDDLMKQMYVVTNDGETHAGAASLKYLSRQHPRLWLAFPVLHIPFSLPFWQFFYDKVAKYRYKIAGKSMECKSGSCQTHFDK